MTQNNAFPPPISSHTPKFVSLSPTPTAQHIPLLLVFRKATICTVYNLNTGDALRTFTAVDVVKQVEWDTEGYVQGCDKVRKLREKCWCEGVLRGGGSMVESTCRIFGRVQKSIFFHPIAYFLPSAVSYLPLLSAKLPLPSSPLSPPPRLSASVSSWSQTAP
jgi:hypothetical protein